MRFKLKSEAEIVVAFEPTAAEYRLQPGESIVVEWPGDGTDGLVSLESGQLVVWAPTGTYNRAWRSNDEEVYIGPESGAEAR
jgi:hypothetical protein